VPSKSHEEIKQIGIDHNCQPLLPTPTMVTSVTMPVMRSDRFSSTVPFLLAWF